MNSHTSPCDHMIFAAKSSPERTQVLRHVTDRLTVRRLVNINPGRPRKPQHHHLWSPRSESKSFSFLKQAHGINKPSRKRGREEVPPPPPAELEEVPPPPPEEVKRLKPPRRKVPPPARGGEADEATPTQGVAAHACSKSKF
jgi:hypothetical protein